MDINKIVRGIAKHYQGKVVRNISFCVDEGPMFEGRISPCTLKMPSLVINFTDDTCVIIEAASDYHNESRVTVSELHVSFWIGRDLIDQWCIDTKAE